MTSNEIIATYETLSSLSGAMLSAARQGEWDHLTLLEQRCQGHIGNLMQATPVQMSVSEQGTKIAIIRAILQNDAEIRALTEPHMHALQQRMQGTRTGQRSIEAYGVQRI